MAINRTYRKPGFEAFDEKELSSADVIKRATCSSGSLGIKCNGEGVGISCNAQIGILCTGKGSIGTSCIQGSSGITCPAGKTAFSCEKGAAATDAPQEDKT